MGKSLIEANPYLKDPELRRRMIIEGAWESSIAEGAEGLPCPQDCEVRVEPSIKAASKKSVKSS